MKAAGVLGCFLFAGSAMAEPSLSIYGIVDVAGQLLSGHTRDVRLISGGLSASRLGFRGEEDLGDGMSASFVLEGGLNVDEGTSQQGGSLFGRQAFLALKVPQGVLSAGRQYSSIFAQTSEFSVFGFVGSGPNMTVIGGFAGGYEPVRGSAPLSHPPAAGSTTNGGPLRADNSVRFTTPEWHGLTASGLYGAGEVTGRTSGSRLVDFSLRYRASDCDTMVSVVDDKTVGTLESGGTDALVTTVTARYTFDPFRIVWGFLDMRDKRPQNDGGRGYWVGADYQYAHQVFKLQFVQNRPARGSDNRTNAIGVGWQFNFTKRTALYSSLTRFQNELNAGSNGLGRINVTVPSGLTIAGDNSVTEAVLGMRHSF